MANTTLQPLICVRDVEASSRWYQRHVSQTRPVGLHVASKACPAPAGRHLCSSRANRNLKLRRSDIGWGMPPLRGLRSFVNGSFLQRCRSYGAWPMLLGRRSAANHSSMLTDYEFSNPNGIVSSSPGLRGTSYPGLSARAVPTPTGLCHLRPASPQPRWGCETINRFLKVARGLATLGFAPESRWDSPRAVRFAPWRPCVFTLNLKRAGARAFNDPWKN